MKLSAGVAIRPGSEYPSRPAEESDAGTRRKAALDRELSAVELTRRHLKIERKTTKIKGSPRTVSSTFKASVSRTKAGPKQDQTNSCNEGIELGHSVIARLLFDNGRFW